MKYNKYAYKNDTAELIELCQFIRDTFPQFKVKREPFLFFDKKGKYVGWRKYITAYEPWKFRNPDVAVFDSGNNLLFCYEVDGFVHDEMFDENNRNKVYEKAGIPLLITVKSLIKTTLIDDAHKKITEFLESIK